MRLANNPTEVLATRLEPSFALVNDKTSSETMPSFGQLPVLAGTQLRLELAMQSAAPDLGAVAAILRADPVAVLTLFAQSRSGSPAALLEEKIITLGRRDLVEIICRKRPARGAQGQIAHAFSQQAHSTARMCRLVADALGLPGEEAFLIGLLHNIGSLPQELGWVRAPEHASMPESLTLALCRHHAVPHALLAGITGIERQDPLSPWSAVMRAALELLASRTAAASVITSLSGSPALIPSRHLAENSMRVKGMPWQQLPEVPSL